MAGHPNRGYVLHPDGQYGPENVPGAAQTQVIGINDNHITVGFWADAAGQQPRLLRDPPARLPHG